MPAKYQRLSPTAAETVKIMVESMFLDGNCYAFAIALHRHLGFPIYGLFTGEYQGPRHAVVSDGSLYDARGKFAIDDPEFGKPFGATPPYELLEATEDELRKVRPVSDRIIRVALRMAEILWPEYPWKGGPARRIIEFANDLEAVCRRHGMWLFTPGAMPIVINEDPEAGKGYVVRATEDGVGYSLTRYLTDDPA